MKTIIIPARCQSTFIRSFQLSCSLFSDQSIKCIFLEIRAIPDNYNDLLTLSRNAHSSTIFDQSFIKTINQLNQVYEGRITLETDYLYGDSPAVFRNYIQHKNCDLIIYDKHESQNNKYEHKLNIFRMVSRSGCEMIYISSDDFLSSTSPINYRSNDKIKKEINSAPASILYQFNAVNERLTDAHNNLYGERIISKKYSNLSRYFLRENLLQKHLSQSQSGLLLLKK